VCVSPVPRHWESRPIKFPSPGGTALAPAPLGLASGHALSPHPAPGEAERCRQPAKTVLAFRNHNTACHPAHQERSAPKSAPTVAPASRLAVTRTSPSAFVKSDFSPKPETSRSRPSQEPDSTHACAFTADARAGGAVCISPVPRHWDSSPIKFLSPGGTALAPAPRGLASDHALSPHPAPGETERCRQPAKNVSGFTRRGERKNSIRSLGGINRREAGVSTLA